jgi:hypothetical protein
MAHINIDIPDELAQRLQQFQSQLPEVLELGLKEFQSQQRRSRFLDELDTITLLASQPPPEQILKIRPSPEFQSRDSDLLAQSKTGVLSVKGEA